MPDPHRQLVNQGVRYALSLCGDKPGAEDLLQEGWASMLRAGGRQDKATLFRAIRSRWIDGWRRSKVVQFEGISQPVPDPSTDPRDLDRTALFQALATCSDDQREALYLCVVEGYTAAEAGELMDKPRNTILSLLHRGRATLRDWFAQNDSLEAL